MTRGGGRQSGEHGVVLYGSLLILSLLVTIGVGAHVMLRTDFQILANLRGNTAAFYLADGGIEWGKEEIQKDSNHPPRPPDRSQEFSAGRFAVEFTAVGRATPLSAQVKLKSTGTVGNSSHVIEAQITKSYDLADAAVSLRGSAGRVIFGNSFLISGLDHDAATGQMLAGSKSRPAIAVADDTMLVLVRQSIADAQTGSVETGEESAALSQSVYLSGSKIAGLANDLCASAQAVRSFVPVSGTLSVENQIWGARAAPQARCFEGLVESGDAVNLTAVSGAGILVVRNADLIVNGVFRWEGLIIVTGGNVGFHTGGGDVKEIRGALFVNETANPGSARAMLDIQGSMRVLFSRSALGAAASLLPASTLQSTYGSLPSMLSQDYWRSMRAES